MVRTGRPAVDPISVLAGLCLPTGEAESAISTLADHYDWKSSAITLTRSLGVRSARFCR